MVDFGTALSVAQTLFAALECSLLNEAYSVSNYESELERLKITVTTVKSVLADAGKITELSETDLDYVKKLKDAVYDADDLFDKFLTIAARKENGSLSDKVSLFFSSENPVKIAHTIFRDVNNIKDHLDAIAADRTKFALSDRETTESIRKRREETCSYVYANDIVGRDGDATKIIDSLLLDSTDHIEFLTIVGIGGMGKTTLAQLVFSHKRILESDFTQRLWVCVADQDATQFNAKVILLKMLELVECKLENDPAIEKVYTEYQRKLGGKKILLVLDNLWSEDPFEWGRLRDFLRIGGKGSRIIVTTRSKVTASIVGKGIHVLQGLSEEDSWRLFKICAFDKESKHPEFDDISNRIIQKCSNLPLAIKVVGCLLLDQPIDTWQLFETNGITGNSKSEDKIMSILKFSYDQLQPSLKSCFAYCAIFPKGFVIKKGNLLNLWDAQGYIAPFDDNQSIENAGEEHFSILLKRCFFQDVKKNKYDDVESFKIHDLMHDLAQKISKSDIFIINSTTFSLKPTPCHVFEYEYNPCETIYLIKSKIRSYLIKDAHKFPSLTDYRDERTMALMDKIVKNWISLRTLSVTGQPIISLPRTMGNLIHLRYLSLADSRIMYLPKTIVKLHNLQTLNLNYCRFLKELPKKFCKLVNLTHLYLTGTDRLEYMPVGMSKLRSLRVLTTFVVKDEFPSGSQCVGQLRDLKALAVNLRGEIFIKLAEDLRCEKGRNWVDNIFACLEGAEQLKEAAINYHGETEMPIWLTSSNIPIKYSPYFKKFELNCYRGETLTSILPNLVEINLRSCHRLQQLPLLSVLLHLKHLYLEYMWTLEYIEEVSSRSSESKFTFFPSLETLHIQECGKLKGWSRGEDRSNCQLAFPRLSQLTIAWCRGLTSFPACPSLHSLLLRDNNKALRITTTDEGQSSSSSALSCYNEKSSINPDSGNTKVGLFKVDHIAHLKPVTSPFVTKLQISHDKKVERLSEVEEMFKSCSSLNILDILHCSKLTSLCGGLEHLIALHSLSLQWCDVLKLEEGEHGDDGNGMPWRALHNNLRSLELRGLPKVEKLPMGMKYLTSLQRLHIKRCGNLKEISEWVGCLQSLQSLDIWECDAITSLPDAMLKLTSLQKLHIWRCQGLKEGCREPNGQDWPKIKHIPQIDLDFPLEMSEFFPYCMDQNFKGG